MVRVKRPIARWSEKPEMCPKELKKSPEYVSLFLLHKLYFLGNLGSYDEW